jgi:hypothetical protein
MQAAFQLRAGCAGWRRVRKISALIGAYVLAGELAAASGAYQTAFHQYEKEMRPFIVLNQALGIKSANLMRPKEKNVFAWLLEQIMRIATGRMIEFIINRSTRRIHQAANAITLKDYSSFVDTSTSRRASA